MTVFCRWRHPLSVSGRKNGAVASSAWICFAAAPLRTWFLPLFYECHDSKYNADDFINPDKRTHDGEDDAKYRDAGKKAE